jgi:DHA2 family metal-tetracycline-proton antiporter-like MFS transporter
MSICNQDLKSRKSHTWIVVSLALAAFVAKLNTYIVNIALPTISHYFKVGTSEVSQTVIIYLVAGTSTLLFFGKLGDRVGLKKVFVAGYALFTIGSFLCGISWSCHVLVLSRFVQGLGGAMLLASSYAIIPKSLPSEITGFAFGLLTTAAMLGIAVGAPLGGFITGFLSWHWIFLISVPVGFVAILISHRSLPSEPPSSGLSKERVERFDIVGALLSLLGLATGMYGLTMGDQWGWISTPELAMVGVSLASLTGFVVWETICPFPLLNFQLLRNPPFLYANMAAFFGYILMAGNGFLMPFYLEWVKGIDTVTVGLFLMIYSLAAMVVGPVAGGSSDRILPSFVTAGAMFSAACCAFFFSAEVASPNLVPVTICLIWLGFSYGAFVSPNNNQAMKAAPVDKQGVASGLFNTVNSLGLAVGVALFQMLFSEAVPQKSLPTELMAVDIQDLIPGFRAAYIFGGIGCLVAVAFSVMIPLSSKRSAS